MKLQDHTELHAEVTIPAHLAWNLPELAEYRPPINRLADAELAKLDSPEAKLEIERRQAFVEQAIADRRVRYVKLLANPRNDASLWWSLFTPNRNPWGENHHSYGSTLVQALWYARQGLSRYDEGGVIFIEGTPHGFRDEREDQTIYLWASECAALKETGMHDWFYVPTGDDICRSCGLIS